MENNPLNYIDNKGLRISLGALVDLWVCSYAYKELQRLKNKRLVMLDVARSEIYNKEAVRLRWLSGCLNSANYCKSINAYNHPCDNDKDCEKVYKDCADDANRDYDDKVRNIQRKNKTMMEAIAREEAQAVASCTPLPSIRIPGSK